MTQAGMQGAPLQQSAGVGGPHMIRPGGPPMGAPNMSMPPPGMGIRPNMANPPPNAEVR